MIEVAYKGSTLIKDHEIQFFVRDYNVNLESVNGSFCFNFVLVTCKDL